MKQKTKILMISYGAAAVFTVTGMIFTAAGGAEGYRMSQDIEYERAMAELVSSVSKMDAALDKGSYASGAEMSGKVCAQLMGASQAASTALSILPLETYALEEVAGFLSQMEEFARVKGAMTTSGEGFDEADRNTFERLRHVTEQLVPALGEMYHHLSLGGLSIRGWIQEDGLVTDEPDNYLEDEILALLHDFPETPELIYAGKLSDDYDNSYAAVKDLQEVSEEQAKAVAEKLTGETELTATGHSQGQLPGYYFSGENEQGTLTVTVTQQGGLPELYLQEYSPAEPAITEAEAKQAAQAFLQKAGYDNMREESASEVGGLMKLTYVYADDSAAFLSDAVNVTVAMDTGTIVAMDASDYLRSHSRQEKTEEPALTAQEAAETAVPEDLTVTKEELTWFTGETGVTSLCWRFVCSRGDEEACVIYANANTGEQVEIHPQT